MMVYKMKNFSYVFLILMLFASCNTPEARKPISEKGGSFIKESVNRNKVLIAEEEKLIEDIIGKDSLHLYYSSDNGFWYYYQLKDSLATKKPTIEDVVTFSYDVATLDGTIIYTKEELGQQKYAVDKQPIMSGLRHGIKLMKVGETVTFLFPSHIAYGYHGDNNKIGINVPLQSTVTVHSIKKDKKNETQIQN